MNILSLFGGIECGRVALDRLGIPVEKYFSSEIDPYAIKITQANYPDIVHIGSVTDISYGTTEDGNKSLYMALLYSLTLNMVTYYLGLFSISCGVFCIAFYNFKNK